MRGEIEEYYDRTVEIEWSRMDRHPFEFAVSKRHIESILGDSQRIADIGGGPGRYSVYFAEKGHRVTLVDLSENNIKFAESMARQKGINLEKALKGNALDLATLNDNSFDVVLCMGPIYHLISQDDRNKAIGECLRILKPNGYLVVSFITTYAQTLTVISRTPTKLREYQAMLHESIRTGIVRSDSPIPFTQAYLVNPEDIESLMSNYKLRTQLIAGAEGIGCPWEDQIAKLDSATIESVIEFGYKYSLNKSLLVMNKHVLYIGQKIAE